MGLADHLQSPFLEATLRHLTAGFVQRFYVLMEYGRLLNKNIQEILGCEPRKDTSLFMYFCFCTNSEYRYIAQDLNRAHFLRAA